MRGWHSFPFPTSTHKAHLAAIQSWKRCLILNWQSACSADYIGRAGVRQPSLPTYTSALGYVNIFPYPQSLTHLIAFILCYREWFSRCPFPNLLPRFWDSYKVKTLVLLPWMPRINWSIPTPFPQRYTRMYVEPIPHLCPKYTSSLSILTHVSTSTVKVTVCALAWVFNWVTSMMLYVFISCGAITNYSLPWLWCFILFYIIYTSDSLESQLMSRKYPKWIRTVLYKTSLSGEAEGLLLTPVSFFCLLLLLTFKLLFSAEKLAKLCVYCDSLLN